MGGYVRSGREMRSLALTLKTVENAKTHLQSEHVGALLYKVISDREYLQVVACDNLFISLKGCGRVIPVISVLLKLRFCCSTPTC